MKYSAKSLENHIDMRQAQSGQSRMKSGLRENLAVHEKENGRVTKCFLQGTGPESMIWFPHLNKMTDDCLAFK